MYSHTQIETQKGRQKNSSLLMAPPCMYREEAYSTVSPNQKKRKNKTICTVHTAHVHSKRLRDD